MHVCSCCGDRKRGSFRFQYVCRMLSSRVTPWITGFFSSGNRTLCWIWLCSLQLFWAVSACQHLKAWSVLHSAMPWINDLPLAKQAAVCLQLHNYQTDDDKLTLTRLRRFFSLLTLFLLLSLPCVPRGQSTTRPVHLIVMLLPHLQNPSQKTYPYSTQHQQPRAPERQ